MSQHMGFSLLMEVGMHAGDMDGILSQQFSADWARVAMKQRFVALIGRSDKVRMAGDSEELQAGAIN